jgi:hypothetical protein
VALGDAWLLGWRIAFSLPTVYCSRLLDGAVWYVLSRSSAPAQWSIDHARMHMHCGYLHPYSLARGTFGYLESREHVPWSNANAKLYRQTIDFLGAAR